MYSIESSEVKVKKNYPRKRFESFFWDEGFMFMYVELRNVISTYSL